MSHITFMPNVVAPAISIRLLGHSVRSLYAVCACVCVCARVCMCTCVVLVEQVLFHLLEYGTKIT